MNERLPIRYEDLVVVGRGHAKSTDQRTLRRVVRYADEAAWLTAEATAAALHHTSDELGSHNRDAGIISISSIGPRTTLKRTAKDCQGQFVSPLQFPAANPASIAGLPCIAFSLNGPTLNITLPPRRGVAVGLLIAKAWLRRKSARVVLLVTYQFDSGREPLSRCLLLALASEFVGYPEDLKSDVLWLENAHSDGCHQ